MKIAKGVWTNIKMVKKVEQTEESNHGTLKKRSKKANCKFQWEREGGAGVENVARNSCRWENLEKVGFFEWTQELILSGQWACMNTPAHCPSFILLWERSPYV